MQQAQHRRRRKLVSSRSPSSWCFTRRHLQRSGADNHNANFGGQIARWISFQVHHKKTCNKKEYPMCLARPQNVQSKKWATSRCTNLAKQSEQLSVLHACGIPKKGQFTACAVSVDPLGVIKRGVRGPEDWQCHHWKAKDVTKNVKKIDYTTIAKRWKDDPSHRETQQVHGWTLKYCIFLDYLKTVEIEHQATREHGPRHHNQYVLRWKDETSPGKMSIEDDF